MKNKNMHNNNNSNNSDRKIELLNKLLDDLPCIAMVIKHDGREIVQSNKKARDIGAVPGKHCYKACFGEEKPCPFCLAPELCKTGSSQSLEISLGDKYYKSYWNRLDDELYTHFLFDITQEKLCEKNRLEHEMRYKQMFVTNQAVKLVIDPEDGRIVEANPSALSFYGYDIETIQKMTIMDINMMDSEDVKKAMQRAKSGQHLYFAFRHKLASGEIKDVEVYSGPLQYGEKSLLYSIIHDITERKQFEKRLNESKKMLQRVIDLLHIRIFWKDKDLKYLGCNKAFANDAEMSEPSELIGKDDFQMVWKNEAELYQKDDKYIIDNSKERLDFEEPQTNSVGDTIWLNTSKVPLTDESGHTIGVLGTYEDVTDKKIFQEKMNDLAKFPEENNNPVFRTSKSGNLLYMNNAASQNILGPIIQIGEKVPDYILVYISEMLGKSEKLTTEFELAGHYYIFDFVPISDGEYVNAYGRDITLQKLAENEKAELTKQLLHNQKMEAMGRLSGGVAHDFNNILTAIIGNIEFLISEVGVDYKYKSDLEEIRNISLRAAELVKQLLTFSRNDILKKKNMNINDVILNSDKMLRRIIGENITIKYDLENSNPVIYADESNINQIILNLAVNSSDAMSEGGIIKIKTKISVFTSSEAAFIDNIQSGKYLCLSFEDNGSGIDKQIIDKIFEPFFTTKGIDKGTGLGLSVVFGIVHSHDAGINVYSEVGKGTVFNLYFPLKKSNGTSANQKKSSLNLNNAGNMEKLLVIEDEPAILNFLKKLFIKKNYNALYASNISEAKKLYEIDPSSYDMIFSDMVLPDGNGLELIKQLNEIYPIEKILLSSGYLDDQSRWEEIKNKAYPFIHKPYNAVQLLEKIYQIIHETCKY